MVRFPMGRPEISCHLSQNPLGSGAMDPVMRLSASDLVCIRGSREIFADLSFTLGAGEALVVRGPNGVGKSSLLRLIAGLIHIAAGRLDLDGGDPELTIAE